MSFEDKRVGPITTLELITSQEHDTYQSPRNNQHKKLSRLTHTIQVVRDQDPTIVEKAQNAISTASSPLLQLSGESLVGRRRLHSFVNKMTQITNIRSSHSPPHSPVFSRNQVSAQLYQWIEEGFLSLKEIVENPRSYPYDQIMTINHPALMEQLIIIHHLLKKVSDINKDEQHILQLALFTASQANSDSGEPGARNKAIEDAYTSLSMIIFALDKHASEMQRYILVEGCSNLVEWSYKRFSDDVNEVKSKIELEKARFEKTPLQNIDLVTRNLVILETAKLLLTKSGVVNAGLIDNIQNKFKLPTNISYLKYAPQVRENIKAIQAPTSETALGSQIIRIALNLDKDKKITHYHARLTAMTALFAHHRQGPAGICFATSLAIYLLAARPNECVKDFAALFENNALTRSVDGVKIQFPYLLTATSESISNQLSVTKEGNLIVKGVPTGYLWEAPGIQAAAQCAGVKNLKEFILQRIEREFVGSAENKDTRLIQIGALLQEMSNGNAEIYRKAIITFESQISNPLLHAWENALAGMAEGQQQGIFKTSILNSTVEILKNKLTSSFPGLPEPLATIIIYNIKDELASSIRAYYDPTITQNSPNKDLHSNQGAFVLYDRQEAFDSRKWERVDTPEKFQSFIKKVCAKAFEKVFDACNAKATLSSLNAKAIIMEFLKTDAFLTQVIQRMNHIKISLPKETALQQKNTPWISRIGNNPKKVLQVYLEEKSPLSTERFMPLTSQHLLEKVISLGKKRSENIEKGAIINPYLFTPVRTPGTHSFSLMLGHPSLCKAWEDDTNLLTWIKNCVIDPGKKASLTPFGIVSRIRLHSYIKNHLLKPELYDAFKEGYDALPDNLSTTAFRYKIVELLNKVHPMEGELMQFRKRKLDTYVYRSLPKNTKKELENSAVHFADTNWYEDIHDLHFCFVVNPGNNRLEIWEAYDNGTHLVALDQDDWLHNQEWEFYRTFFTQERYPSKFIS